MAVEIPKEIFDYSLRSQIYNLRFSNQVSRDIIALLNSADKEIIAKLEATNGDFSKRRLEAVLKEIRKINAKTYAEAHSEMETAMLDFGAHVAEATTGMMATQLPMSWNPFAVSREQLQAIVSDTPITVGADGKLLLEEIFQSLAAGKEKDIRGAIRLGMVEGETIPQMVTRLRGTKAAQFRDGVLEVSRRHAEAMTRTIVNHTSSNAMMATFKNNAAVMNSWTYLATLDSRTCLICIGYSGQSFPLGEGPIPPQHVATRSIPIPNIKTWKELGVDIEEMPPAMRASKNGPVRADISFSDWLKGQDKATQVDILGKTRQQLWTEGKLPLTSFTDDKGRVLNLEQLKEAHKAAFARAFG